MMNCPACKTNNPQQARFCQQCGLQFGQAPPPQHVQQPIRHPFRSAPQQKKMSVGIKLIMVIGGFALVGMISTGLSQLTKPNTAKPAYTATPSAASIAPAIAATAPTIPGEIKIRPPSELLAEAKKHSSGKNPQYRVAESLIAQIPASAPEYKEASALLKQVQAKIIAAEAEVNKDQIAELRTKLESSYRWLIVGANPHYNFISSKLTKVKGGYAIFATHEFFNQYNFSAGDDAKITRKWITENYSDLRKAQIVRVGMMGKGPYSSSCRLEVN